MTHMSIPPLVTEAIGEAFISCGKLNSVRLCHHRVKKCVMHSEAFRLTSPINKSSPIMQNKETTQNIQNEFFLFEASFDIVDEKVISRLKIRKYIFISLF